MFYGLSIITTKIIAAVGSPLDHFPGMAGFVAATGALITAVLIEAIASNVPWKSALTQIGFKAGSCRPVVPVLAGIAVILLGYVGITKFLKQSPELEQGFLFLSFKLLISQGLIEEAVFRGLIFRRLRRGRTFWRAASFGGLLFAFIHMVNFVKGVTPEIMIAVGTSILYGFILTFPLAMLFELGAGSIIAGGVFHLAVDSINCFKNLGSPGAPINIYLGTLIVASVAILGVGQLIRRQSSDRQL